MSEKNSSQAARRDAVILIPSLEPDERLPAYIEKLVDSGFGHVVVVDDGSAASYQPIFECFIWKSGKIRNAAFWKNTNIFAFRSVCTTFE